MSLGIAPDKLAEAHRAGNAIGNATQRGYYFAYVAWMRNGTQGHEPSSRGISRRTAQSIRDAIIAMRLWG